MAGPKLLDKKVVNTEVATQRKQQIDLGLSMSKKVDAVRESLLEEEANLEAFRKNTIARVQAEIDGYIRQRDSIKGEVAALEEWRALSLKPITAEWEEVHKAKDALIKDKADFQQKSLSLLEREKQLEPIEKQTLKDKENALQLRTLATTFYSEADAALKSAEKHSIKTRREADQVLTDAETKERKVLAKEKSVLKREATSLERSAELDERETDLANRELTLKDRYATLERTLIRLKTK